jgi:hypothetical protein
MHLMTAAALALLLAGCATQKYDSAREWERGECNRVVDKDDRARCLRRVDGDYSRKSTEPAPGTRK